MHKTKDYNRIYTKKIGTNSETGAYSALDIDTKQRTKKTAKKFQKRVDK